MFPYTNTDNNLDSLFKKQYFHQIYEQIQNPISESPFFSNLPSPFFDEQELPLNQIFLTDERNTEKESPKHQPTKPLRRRNLAAEPRKRTGKKDRHSKICTAQGIRDRRMRLSLPVARKFFDLQDMLGYDKASKTIEWLCDQSKKAIKDLTEDIVKSESDCEVVSGIEENSNNNEMDGGEERPENNEESEKKHRRTPNTRESREKARERARCRTEEKKMGKRIEDPKSSPNTISPNFEKLGLSSSSPFDRDEEERVSPCDASDYYPLLHQPSDVGTIEKLLGNSSSSASNFATSYCVDPSFKGFLGIWDNLQSNERLNYAVTKIEASIQGNPNSIYSATTSDFALFHQ